MKTQYKFFISILAIICAWSTLLNAQDYCANKQAQRQYYLDFIQSRRTNALHIFPSTKKQARIFFHIVTDDDRSKPAATLKDVSNELDSMGLDYGPGNICFDSAGLNYVASTYINSGIIIDSNPANGQMANDSLNKYYIPGCLNIFYVSKIGGVNQNNNNPGHGGYTFGCPNPISIVSKDRLAKNSTPDKVVGHSSSHESGHMLGLMHTYDTRFGEEYIDGRDSDKLGDLMPDTQADPYSHEGEDCFSQTTDRTLYTGHCPDPAGRKDFSPPYNNLMSYWKPPVRIFTRDQFYEVKYNLLTKNAGVASADDLVIQTSSYHKGYVYKSAINTLTTNGNVVFNDAVTAGLFGNAVTLKAGFNASPLTGSVLIKATECHTTGSAATAKNSVSSTQQVVVNAGIKEETDNSLIIYPNPSTKYFNIQYSQAAAFDALVSVRNRNGGVIFSTSKNNIFKLLEKIDPGTNARGVYFVEVYINGKRLTAKAVLL